MEFKLSTFSLRSLRRSDATSLATHIGNPNVSRYMSGVPYPYSLRDAEEWLEKVLAQTPEIHFGIVIDDQVVGAIDLRPDASGLDVFKHAAEIGYWLGEPFWKRGIMSEAVAALTEWGFEERQLVRIHAVVYAPNEPSARVLKKTGYEFVGRSRAHYFRGGEFIDALLYSQVRLPH